MLWVIRNREFADTFYSSPEAQDYSKIKFSLCIWWNTVNNLRVYTILWILFMILSFVSNSRCLCVMCNIRRALTSKHLSVSIFFTACVFHNAFSKWIYTIPWYHLYYDVCRTVYWSYVIVCHLLYILHKVSVHSVSIKVELPHINKMDLTFSRIYAKFLRYFLIKARSIGRVGVIVDFHLRKFYAEWLHHLPRFIFAYD